VGGGRGGSGGGGEGGEIPTKQPRNEAKVNMPQEISVSWGMRTLWETDFGSSSEIIVLENAMQDLEKW
jgi:hypothetical protein